MSSGHIQHSQYQDVVINHENHEKHEEGEGLQIDNIKCQGAALCIFQNKIIKKFHDLMKIRRNHGIYNSTYQQVSP